MSAIGLLGALLGLLLGLGLLTQRRGPLSANRRLGWLLLASGAAVGAIAATHLLDAARTPWLLLELVAALAVGPLLLGYVRAALRPAGAPPDEPLLLHLLPAAAAAVYAPAALALLARAPAGWEPWLPSTAAVVAYQALYTALAAGAAVRLGRALPQHPRRRWVWSLLGVLGAVHAAQLIRLLRPDEPALRELVPATATLALYALAVLGVRESSFVLLEQLPKYRSSSLDAVRSREIAAAARAALERDRAFLDPDLDLPGLAARLGVLPGHLSQSVNQELGQSFLDLVNALRVAEAQRLLREPGHRHLTVDAIAARSGFHSRSSFYSAFRKVSGTTPRAYREQPAGSLPS
ncbi:MAG TPA: helix-turn-helix domain-containing protein [Thermoanaerobaculia bacterium]|nr:helix-turn-helix domain-containing protein [Thermoanaerobaculia bacterium]